VSIPIVAVVGATATGKSGLGLTLAAQLGGEVVNADAKHLYPRMDIGTAKLPVEERRGIVHHQLDVLDVTEEASVAAYQTAARADLAAIRERGQVPIVVGGSGLYVRAALDVLDIPPTDAAVRSRLEQEAERDGAEAIYRRLVGVDPEAAARIQPANVRRVVRALEVIELTNRPFSASMPERQFVAPTVMIGLSVEQPALDERIDRRAEAMWRDGLQDEVETLLTLGLRDGATASRAIGYSQAIAVIDGKLSRTDALEQTAQTTRRYARRQLSWFRPDHRITWLDATQALPHREALELVRRPA
jgi:tRNA dimethylallyltransferase